MNAFTTIIVLTITFAFGAVVGETWAPLSGLTTQALAARCASLEARVIAIEGRYEELKSEVDACVRDAGFRGGKL
jgi:hypothetical protein